MKYPTPYKPRDINQLPAEEGMLIFGISPSRISNAQSAQRCFEYLQHLDKKIVKTIGIGCAFLYADYLYFHSNEPAAPLRSRLSALMAAHKNAFFRILSRHLEYVPKAFSFITWGQFLLDCKEFGEYFGKLKKIYRADRNFQRYLAADARAAGKRKVDEHQVNFFLEEMLGLYLIQKGVVSLPNEFVNHHEKWALHCYPGKPLASELYFHQQNFFKLQNPRNKYENGMYDLAGKRYYDYTRIDLASFRP